MIDITGSNSKEIVGKLVKYMQSKGLVFRKIDLDDSSPYAILSGETSLGYRTRSKWGRTGVVFFCSQDRVDADKMVLNLNLPIDDNSRDAARPYAIFVPDSKVEKAIELLAENPLNRDLTSKTANYDHPVRKTSKPARTRKETYQSRYWDRYFLYVKQALARDGYSNSDSNTETTVRDTFYLERKDETDFLTWFESQESLERAKQRLVELLTAAKRQSSSLKNDIKYYTRDITYFSEFYWNETGMNPAGSKYQFIRNLKNKSNVSLVKNNEDGKLYVRKEYDVFNYDVFERLQNAHIDGLPIITDLQRSGKKLYTIEEYIDGKTLLEKMDAEGPFSENEMRHIALELCQILKRLHSMEPTLLHRDIKPSNIMMTGSGKVFLIDFNASKTVHENRTEDTILYGTQYFAAPEQLLGYGVSRPATDVFGLGATMNYLVTGGLYHTQMIASGMLHDIIDKCTEIDWNNRYQSIDELETALKNA